MTADGLGGVSGGSGFGPSLAPIGLNLLQLTRREIVLDRAVDDASLEAGVRIAKGYRGRHDGSQ
jgi:hypothetical protein